MSADKHKGLARRTAYLRLAASHGDAGFAVQVKWAYAVTSYVEDLLALGYRRRTRQSACGRKRVTCMVITATGEDFLHQTLARRGSSFGPTSLIREFDPRKVLKDEKCRIADQTAGYVSRRVYTGIRHLDAAMAVRHRERIQRSLAEVKPSSIPATAIA